jgi:hypothetical protein
VDPDNIDTEPALRPEPAAMLSDPPSIRADPALRTMAPAEPLIDSPVDTVTSPEERVVVDPVFTVTEPLLAVAFTDSIKTEPLEAPMLDVGPPAM